MGGVSVNALLEITLGNFKFVIQGFWDTFATLSMSPKPSIHYRPEIDGLRALAVIPVLLYHAGFGFPGGYAGVDVFFVISGYLIGSVILKEAESGKFTFGAFWMRRLRRLFPSCAIVIVATLVAAVLCFIPPHLEAFGESLLYQPILAANIYFWNQTGYFETASEFQPLLHTWSLAVEEQFYILLPLVLLPLIRLGRRAVRLALIAFIIISLGVSVYFSVRFPSFAFFMLPARIWELDMGVMLALISAKGFRFRRANEFGSVLGVLLILSAYFLFDLNTPFPGYAALLPCLGAALIIFTNGGGLCRTGRVLSHPFAVGVGKISYPLYLWHWPVIVFLKYLWIEEPPFPVMAGSLLFSAGLAWMTFRWIETPIRTRKWLSGTKSLSLSALAFSGFIVASGWFFMKKEGLPDRFSSDVHEVLSAAKVEGFAYRETKEPVYGISEWDKRGGACKIGEQDSPGARLLLWGDSHALTLVTLLNELGKKHGVEVIIAAEAGVAPIPGTYPSGRGPETLAIPRQVEEWLDDSAVDEVLFVSKWAMYVFGRNDGKLDRLLRSETERADTPSEEAEIFRSHFSRLIKKIEERGINVSVMRTVAFQRRSVPETLAQIASRGKNLNAMALPVSVHRRESAEMNELLDRSVAGTKASLLDPFPFFEEDGIYLMAKDGKPLYSDRDHLSVFGADRLRPLLEPLFESAVQKASK